MKKSSKESDVKMLTHRKFDRLDYLYHRVENKDEIIDSIKKHGLLSHSNIGRCDEWGDPLPEQHRIWFQSDLKTGFEDFTPHLNDPSITVFRIASGHVAIKKDIHVIEDDQFFDEHKHVVMAVRDCERLSNNECEFSINPCDLEVFDTKQKQWVPFTDECDIEKKDRTLMESLSPVIASDFKTYGFEPKEKVDVKSYCILNTFSEEETVKNHLHDLDWWDEEEINELLETRDKLWYE